MHISEARQFRRNRAVRAGFTLVEVLLVLAIIGVIMAIAVPMLLGQQREAMVKATKVAIGSLEGALKLYAQNHDGEYPNSNQGLEVLLVSPGNDPNWHGPYLDSHGKLPPDAWGRPLQYQYPGTNNPGQPDIWSYGADGQPNTDDDINNWTTTK